MYASRIIQSMNMPDRMIQRAVAASVMVRMGLSLVASVSVPLFTPVSTAQRYRVPSAFARCVGSPNNWAKRSVPNVILFVDPAVV